MENLYEQDIVNQGDNLLNKSLYSEYNNLNEYKNNYDEYNKNNRLVNDINYSYYLNRNKKNQIFNNDNINTLNAYSPSMSSNLDIRANERERKKILLNNIQSQMNLKRQMKLNELNKNKEEDRKYLKDMVEKYPFGNKNKNFNYRYDNNINTKRPFSTINVNNMNYNEDLDDKIIERKMKQLEMEKEEEEIQSSKLKEENNKLENDLFLQSNISNNNKNKSYTNNLDTYNPIKENDNEYEYQNEEEPKNTTSKNKDKILLNPVDYYDNINFVPKSQINQRLDNNFLFSEELSRLRDDIQKEQRALLKQISRLRDDSLIAKKERDKVKNDLDIIKSQLFNLNEQRKEEEEKKNENLIAHNMEKEYDNFIKNNLKKNYNDYDYVDKNFFKKFEYELPNKSDYIKNRNIFHVEQNYEDRDKIELDSLIKKSNDIMTNFRENEIREEKYKQRPENYFNTSDYFFDTYWLEHKNDYLDKDYLGYNNKYNIYDKNINNKFIDFEDNNDFDVNVETI